MNQSSDLLAISGLTVKFGGLTALDDVFLKVAPNSVVGLIGPNGAGKTTLFNAISGLVEPDVGSIAYEGKNDPLCITLYEGGLEKFAEPSICSFMENVPRVVLVGAPQVVDFLFPHLVKCVDEHHRKSPAKAIKAGDVWGYVIKREEFQGDPANCADFQLLARNHTK